MSLNKPKLNTPMPVTYVYFSDKRTKADCFYFSGKQVGEIFLTKIDTVNHIVSGRFQFRVQCSDETDYIIGDSIVSITNGRFDLKLTVY